MIFFTLHIKAVSLSNILVIFTRLHDITYPEDIISFIITNVFVQNKIGELYGTTFFVEEVYFA